MNYKAPIFAILFCLPLSNECNPSHPRPYFLSQNVEVESTNETLVAIQKKIEFLEMITLEPSFHELSLSDRYSSYISLSHAYEQIGRFSEQDNLIKKLLDEKTYHTYEIQLKVHLANSYLYQGMTEKGQELFRELSKKRKQNLEPHERLEISLLGLKLEQHYNQILLQANTFYTSKEYSKASSLYQTIKIAAEKRLLPCGLSKQSRRQFLCYINHRLSHCYFLDQEYKKAISILNTRKKQLYFSTQAFKGLFWQGTFLKATAYKKLGHYKEAREAFFEYLQNNTTRLYPEGLLEVAFCSLQLRDWQNVKDQLNLLAQQTIPKELLNRASIIEILLEIETKNFIDAALILENLKQKATQGSPLSFELAYLQGYLSYRLGDLEKAVMYFEKSVEASFSVEWENDAFYFLGCLYLEIAQNAALSSDDQHRAYFERALDCFHLTIQKSSGYKKQKAYLGLSSTLLAQSKHLKVSKNTLSQLLIEASSCCSQETLYAISFSIAQCTGDYTHLLEEKYKQQRIYPQVLFNHGKSLLKTHANEGLKILEEVSAISLHHEATSSKQKDLEFYRWIHCLALHEKIYAQGMSDASPLIFELHKFLSCHPQSNHVPEAIGMLGRLLWKEKKYFSSLEAFDNLATGHPNHYRKDETLFFKAMNHEKLYGSSEYTCSLFFELFSQFPSSPHAAESYFRSYSEKSYLTGNDKALLHLKNMPTSMSNSPFAAISAFYVGCYLREQCPDKNLTPSHTKKLDKAIYFFELSRNRSQKFPFLHSFFVHSQFKKAEALLTKSDGEGCLQALALLKESEQTAELWQESAWLRIRALTLQNKKSEAREELDQLIEYGRKNNWLASEYFIKALCVLSLDKTQRKLFEEANDLLIEAEDFQAKGFRRELLLEIWIAKSELYYKQKQFGKAMAILSQVINDTSASSLRIQAMYLRAEIYERQGRKDLAIRQLEAVVKKGGEWASLASSRLVVYKEP